MQKFKKILLEELEYKKRFNSNWPTICDICTLDIEEQDEFVFMGDKRKMCVDCIDELESILEAE